MNAKTISVPGATLYYEVRGGGPPALLIHGAPGDANAMKPLAEQLADRFTVITYDRRGHSRSKPADDPPRAADAWIHENGGDAAALLDALAGEPAYVFGTSSGAVIGLDLAARHPTQVRMLVAHEPPLVGLLPDGDLWRSFLEDVYATYRDIGIVPAMAKFASGIGIDREPPGEASLPYLSMPPNVELWFEGELHHAPRFQVDVEALAAIHERVVIAGGEMSRQYFPSLAGEELARRIGSRFAELPGDHAGPSSQPAGSALKVREAFEAAG